MSCNPDLGKIISDKIGTYNLRGVPEVPPAPHLYFARSVITEHTFGGILTVVFLQNTIKVRCMLNH